MSHTEVPPPDGKPAFISDSGTSPAGRLVNSPVLWGAVAAGAFYAALTLIPDPAGTLDNLFRGHAIAYATTVMFWIGLAGLALKAKTLPAERAALDRPLPRSSEACAADDPVGTARRLRSWLAEIPRRESRTRVVERLEAVIRFVEGRRSSDGLTGHLSYLAEFAGEQLHNSYGLIRTVTWAVPILGFLGTVIGITQAIQNLDPARLESSFGLVSQGLGVAFGTTALALGLSVVLVFASYLVERQEKNLLADIERLALDSVTSLFPAEGAPAPATTSSDPLTQAVAEAARRLLSQTDALIGRHVELWESQLGQLAQAWAGTLDGQRRRLEDSLRQTLDLTLTEQSRALLCSAESQHRLTDAIDRLVAQQQQLADLQQQLVDRQLDLVAAQQRLSDQFDSDRSQEPLDETLHTLSAAVHLLTARVTSRAA